MSITNYFDKFKHVGLCLCHTWNNDKSVRLTLFRKEKVKKMTLETEMASPAAGRNGGYTSDATSTRASEMRKSSASNGGLGCGRGGHTIRGSH